MSYAGNNLYALVSAAISFAFLRLALIRSIMAYKRLAPASVEPLPNSDTILAGITNSPSANLAACLPPIVAGIESDTPSPGPFNKRPPSE